MKRICALLALCLVLAGCAGRAELKKRTFTIELGQDVYANPALYIKNENMNTSTMSIVPVSAGIGKTDNRFVSKGYEWLLVGEYDFELQQGSTVLPFKIKIKDTQAPTVTKEPDVVQASLNQRINWDEVFGATDISGVSYEAPADTTSVRGLNTVAVKISDRFGNSIEKIVNVEVQ